MKFLERKVGMTFVRCKRSSGRQFKFVPVTATVLVGEVRAHFGNGAKPVLALVSDP